ncbi:MAG: hypothetical protein WD030_06615 [Pirellulales bacterium]
MLMNLPDDLVPLVRQKAENAGFGGQVEAYVIHLISSDEVEDYGAPAECSIDGKSKEEIDAMITAGIESGPAVPMTDEDWQRLYDRIDMRAGRKPS